MEIEDLQNFLTGWKEKDDADRISRQRQRDKDIHDIKTTVAVLNEKVDTAITNQSRDINTLNATVYGDDGLVPNVKLMSSRQASIFRVAWIGISAFLTTVAALATTLITGV